MLTRLRRRLLPLDLRPSISSSCETRHTRFPLADFDDTELDAFDASADGGISPRRRSSISLPHDICSIVGDSEVGPAAGGECLSRRSEDGDKGGNDLYHSLDDTSSGLLVISTSESVAMQTEFVNTLNVGAATHEGCVDRHTCGSSTDRGLQTPPLVNQCLPILHMFTAPRLDSFTATSPGSFGCECIIVCIGLVTVDGEQLCLTY